MTVKGISATKLQPIFSVIKFMWYDICDEITFTMYMEVLLTSEAEMNSL